MHPRLSELLDYLDAQRARVLDAAAGLPLDRWTIRPGPDRWSVSEVFWHLQRVEHGIAKLVAMRAREARAAGHPAEVERSSVLGLLEGRAVRDRARRLTAPPRVSPTELPDAATVQQQLEESRVLLRSALVDADGLALGSIVHTHPVLGDIDLYQWILFVGQHEERHLGQITETASAVSGSGEPEVPDHPTTEKS